MPIPSEFLRTERLLFRPFQFEDLDAFSLITADQDVMRYVGDGKTLDREITQLWIEKSRENVEMHGYGTGGLIELETGQFIGWAGMARSPDAPEEIVYGFSRDRWGRGYGPEIVRGMSKFFFEEVGLPEIRARVYPANPASARVLEKAGFTRTPWEHDADELLFLLRKA